VDWVVFGDDWGTHPSTAQHLVLNFPKEDRVVWIDSIGMRQPTLNMADIRRVASKVKMMLRGSNEEGALYQGTLGGLVVVKPKVIPWHMNKVAAYFNVRSLARSIECAMRSIGIKNPVLLTSTPVVVQYLAALPCRTIVYLRQDEYEHYPGCDPILVQKTEPVMFDVADAIFVTARSLYPKGDAGNKTQYLPHGVQLKHFTQIPLQPSGKKILGYFGTIDERMDFELVREVAESAPDWVLEFIGDVLYKPAWIANIPNIRYSPMVPFRELPSCLSDWSAAWIPYLRNQVTQGINPLKLQEYLAAGLASHCTPLPEVLHLNKPVLVTDQAGNIVKWMNDTLATDNEKERIYRRKSVEHDDWSDRSKQLRNSIN
jgi:glycosyltransferase involved in cell wall biosynthesis